MAGNNWGSALGGLMSGLANGWVQGSKLAQQDEELKMMKEYRKAQMEEIAMKRQMQEFELNNEREAALALKNFNGGGQPQQYGDPLKSNTQPTASNLSRPLSNEYVLPDVAAQKGLQTQTQSYNGMTPNIQETPTVPGFVTGARTDKLIPEFNNRLQGMAQAYLAATGEPLQLTDSYRDYNGQVDVRNRKGNLAATPGTSMHGYGGAVDGSSEQFNKADKMGLLKLYGLDRPVNGESWHVQPSGLNSNELKASGRSGDNPGSAYNDYLPKMVGLDETVKRIESMPPVNVQNIVSNSPDVNSAAESLTKQKIVRAMAKMNAMAPHVGSKIGKRYYDMAKDEVEMLTKDTRTPQEKLDAEFNQHVRVDRYNKQSEIGQKVALGPVEARNAALTESATSPIKAAAAKEKDANELVQMYDLDGNAQWVAKKDVATKSGWKTAAPKNTEYVDENNNIKLLPDSKEPPAGWTKKQIDKDETLSGGTSPKELKAVYENDKKQLMTFESGQNLPGEFAKMDGRSREEAIAYLKRSLISTERTLRKMGVSSHPYVDLSKDGDSVIAGEYNLMRRGAEQAAKDVESKKANEAISQPQAQSAPTADNKTNYFADWIKRNPQVTDDQLKKMYEDEKVKRKGNAAALDELNKSFQQMWVLRGKLLKSGGVI